MLINMLLLALPLFMPLAQVNVVQEPRQAPDYENVIKWNEVHDDEEATFDLKGQEVKLLFKQFSFHTSSKVGEHVVILHDTQNQPWLLLHVVEGFDATSSGIYFFEKNEYGWTFVAEFKSENEINTFLNSRYGLTSK